MTGRDFRHYAPLRSRACSEAYLILDVNMPTDTFSCKCLYLEGNMRPLKRSKVRKSESAEAFREGAKRTKAPNQSLAPMRGGWRL